jgi:hypothetical protein
LPKGGGGEERLTLEPIEIKVEDRDGLNLAISDFRWPISNSEIFLP